LSIIKVENLSKKYIIGHDRNAGGGCRYNSLRDSIAHTVRGMCQRLRHPLSANLESTELEDFWALKDINFEIKQGDRVGIIGRNGAGKSTLLKILSRITEPTTGKITLNGRVASLLEVGTGFHPELTGRENIYLNGAVLGMTRIEIKKKFDEIVDFSGVEKFLDTPVKRYSSGMYVRLAFAVAAHLEPEILLVDEVLAVGDAEFQKKCLGKMKDVSMEGRTVLFVSHNMPAVKRLCSRGILLDGGTMLLDSNVENVVSTYNNKSDMVKHEVVDLGIDKPRSKPSQKDSHFKWTEIYIINSTGKKDNKIFYHEPFKIAFKGKAISSSRNILIGLVVRSSLGEIVFNTHQIDNGQGNILKQGINEFVVEVCSNVLRPGYYSVDLGIHGINAADFIENAIIFNISDLSVDEKTWDKTRREGIIDLDCKWSISNC
jgi:lipopolysaccharide transport system ATP-binding protein